MGESNLLHCTYPSEDSGSESQFLLSSNLPLSISHRLPLTRTQRRLQGNGWQAWGKLSLERIQYTVIHTLQYRNLLKVFLFHNLYEL